MVEILFFSLIHIAVIENGRPDPNEYSVLLKFPDSAAVGNYVISCYCQGNTVQFEVQFIAVHLEQFSASFCSRLVRNLKN